MSDGGQVKLHASSSELAPAWSAFGLAGLVVATLAAFAANSLLCRLALGGELIDAPRFTAVRLLSGAAMLAVLLLDRDGGERGRVDPLAAAALFVYAAGFSFAYLALDAGVGALLLFGAVQVTMITTGLLRGERFTPLTSTGLVLALAGLAGYLAPGPGAMPTWAVLCMLVAGGAWGLYSLRGARQADPVMATVRNFIATVPAAFALLALPRANASFSGDGFALAVLSGAVTSALGYVLWYRVLARITAITAAVVQLCVPLLAALFGVLLLGETMPPRLLLAGLAVIGGIGLVILGRRRAAVVR